MKKALLLSAILIVSVRTVDIKKLTKILNENENPLNPKEFNIVFLLKNLKKNDILKGFKAAKLEDHHQMDIIAQLVSHHKQNGGLYKDAYLMTKDDNAKKYLREMMLRFHYNKKSSSPFSFSRAKQGVFYSKKKTLNSCLKDNGVDIELKEFKEKPGKLIIVSKGKEVEMSLEKFYNEGLFDFLIDVCKMVEVSKMQKRDRRRNLYVVHFSTLGQILEGKHSEIAQNVYKSAIREVRSSLEQVYNKEGLNMMHLSYKAAEKLSKNTGRMLEETVVTVQAKNNQVNAFLSIKYGFTVATFFVYMFILIEIFRMKVYKDSLVYSNFLTSKKSE